MFFRTESFSEFIRFYPVVTSLLVIHLVIYLLMLLPGFYGAFVFSTVLGVNYLISDGEYWRLLTPIFAHKQTTHLLFNSFSLFLFGPALEVILGRFKFIFLYLLAGVSANLATLLIKEPTYAHLGASGAIFGLFGFYLAMVMFRQDLLGEENKQIITTIAAISVVMTFLQPNINITAHLFGLFSGFIIGFLAYRSGEKSY